MNNQPVPFSLTWNEVLLFQTLLEHEIAELHKLWKEALGWDDDLAKSFAKRQRELWEKWHDLNKRLRESGQSFYLPAKERELKSLLIIKY